ncbi:hypothetical protein [Streptomyces collinus]|uniref:hypothetical protein n=1 Tax=Streptomyces collinus TaxID=42684 RepID=UPI003645CACF
MTDAPSAAAGTAPEPPAPAPGGERVASASEASVAPSPRPEPRLRLRPGVAVTPLLAGLHLRGRGAGVTLEGSRALPALWQLLSDRLAPDRAVRGAGGAQAGAVAPADGDAQAGAGATANVRVQADAGDRTDVRTPTAAGEAKAGAQAGAPAQAQPQTQAQAQAQPRTQAQAQAAENDQAGPRVEAALATLTARLREHDLLVEHPDGVELLPWPGSSAARPAEAVEAIRSARPVVAAPDPEGPLAMSLVRALRRAGASPRVAADNRLPAGRAVITADAPSGAVALAVSCDAEGGFVTAPGPPNHAHTDAAAIATRLGSDTPPWAPGGPAPEQSRYPTPGTAPSEPSVDAGAPSQVAATPGAPSGTHVALLAGAAAGRLLATVADLPDPAAHEDAVGTASAEFAAVLIARAEPPEATYHPWAAAPHAARRGPGAPPVPDLEEALRRVTALGDPRLGVLDAPLPGDLPQLPASLASCRTPAGLLVAGAVQADLARLEAACRAAELALADGLSTPVVGAGPDHARGRALRRAVLEGIERDAVSTTSEADPVAAYTCACACADGIGEDAWRTHPQARHWWTVLTERMGRSADLTVRQLARGEAHSAVIRVRSTSTVAGAAPSTVSRAVEVTAADAVAFAALDAVTRAMAAEHAPDVALHTALSGAMAPLAVAGVEPAGWADEGWTDVWLASVAAREPALHAALHRLTGLHPGPWQGTGRHHPLAHTLALALRASGFTVLNGAGGPR